MSLFQGTTWKTLGAALLTQFPVFPLSPCDDLVTPGAPTSMFGTPHGCSTFRQRSLKPCI